MTAEDKKKIEAVLFTTGKFTNIDEIARVSELGQVGYVKQLLEELKNDYEQRDSSLQIVQDETNYRLNIKKEYGLLANKLVSSAEFDAPTTKTLAVIAHRKPAFQSDVIKIRGNKAYEHIHILKEQGLVISEHSGRTRILKVTPKFFDYFDTAPDAVKEIFKDVEVKVKEHVASKAGMTVAELDEKSQLLAERERQQQADKEKKKQSSAEQPSENNSQSQEASLPTVQPDIPHSSLEQ